MKRLRLWLALFLLPATIVLADGTIKHRFHSPVTDLGDPNEVGPDEWNDSLKMDGGALGNVPMRDPTQTDGWRWITPLPASGTPVATATAVATSTPAPTSTPLPTATSVPTATPQPTATPVAAVYWLPAAACQNATSGLLWDTPTSNPAVPACVTGSNSQKGVADFADGANSLSLQITLRLPAAYDSSGTTSVVLKWLTTATTGSVVWQVATSCVADAETDDPSFNTASTVTDVAKGTTNQTNDASIASLTMTGCAAGELLHLKVFRDPTNGSDDLAATARLIGVELTVPRL